MKIHCIISSGRLSLELSVSMRLGARMAVCVLIEPLWQRVSCVRMHVGASSCIIRRIESSVALVRKENASPSLAFCEDYAG